MKIRKIKIHNFRSIKDQEVILGNYSNCRVTTGSNEATERIRSNTDQVS